MKLIEQKVREILHGLNVYPAKVDLAAKDISALLAPVEEAFRELIKEVRDMAPVFEKNGMNDTATACLFEAEAAESELALFSEVVDE